MVGANSSFTTTDWCGYTDTTTAGSTYLKADWFRYSIPYIEPDVTPRPATKETNLAWLDRRVSEIRDCWKN